MDNSRSFDRNNSANRKVIDTINYNGRYVDVSTVRNKVISASVAFVALVSACILFFL